MLKKRRGEIATLLTLGLVILGGVLAIGSSVFLSRQKTTNTRAAEEIICDATNDYNCAGVTATCSGGTACGQTSISSTNSSCYRCMGPNCKRNQNPTVYSFPVFDQVDSSQCSENGGVGTTGKANLRQAESVSNSSQLGPGPDVECSTAAGNYAWGPSSGCYIVGGSWRGNYCANKKIGDAKTSQSAPCCAKMPNSNNNCCSSSMQSATAQFLKNYPDFQETFSQKADIYGLNCKDSILSKVDDLQVVVPALPDPAPSSGSSDGSEGETTITVTTGAVTGITNTSAVLHGYVNDKTNKKYKFWWKKKIAASFQNSSLTTVPYNSFTYTATGLIENTTYEYKVCIYDASSELIECGEYEEFTTLATGVIGPAGATGSTAPPAAPVSPATTPTLDVSGGCNDFTCSNNSQLQYSIKCKNPNFGVCGGSWNFYPRPQCLGEPNFFSSLEFIQQNADNTYCINSLRDITLDITLKVIKPIPVDYRKPNAIFKICFNLGGSLSCPVIEVFDLTKVGADGYNIKKEFKGNSQLTWYLTYDPSGNELFDTTLSGRLIESNGSITGNVILN